MSALASRIGSSLIMDAMTTRMFTRGFRSLGYARVLVEAKAEKGLDDHIDVLCPSSEPKNPAFEEAKDGEGCINVGRKKGYDNREKRNMPNNNRPVEKKYWAERKKTNKEDVNAGEGLSKENNKEEFSTPIQIQKKIWKVDEIVMHDVRYTANKFSVLQDIEDDSLARKISVKEKEEVEKYVIMKLQPSSVATSKWSKEMMEYFKKRRRVQCEKYKNEDAVSNEDTDY
ncbi:hypothetical protein Tco_1151406 [Tanacetum coccineum]